MFTVSAAGGATARLGLDFEDPNLYWEALDIRTKTSFSSAILFDQFDVKFHIIYPLERLMVEIFSTKVHLKKKT